MDKILSARVDESVVNKIKILATRLNTSKKKVIESAITMYAQKIEKEKNIDLLDQTFGIWERRESPNKIIENARKTFRESMKRYQK